MSTSKAIDALKGIASFPGTLLVWMQEIETKVAAFETQLQDLGPMLAQLKKEWETFAAKKAAAEEEAAAAAEQAAADKAPAEQVAAEKAAAKKEDPPQK